MPKLKKLLIVPAVLLSSIFLTGCESFQDKCEQTLGGTYHSDSSSSYEYVFVPSKSKYDWEWVYTTVRTCIKDGEIIDQDVSVS